MATSLFAIRNTNYESASPIVTTSGQLTAQSLADWLRAVSSGSASGNVLMQTARDQVAASATLVDNGLTGGDVAGATISGVDATATYASSPNNTLTLIKNKINNGGNTPNDLITKAVYATRYFTNASAYFTLSGASGSLSPEVDGTACAFTAVDDDAADAAALAAAINAQATAGLKVFAYSDGVDKCYVVAAGTNRAAVTLSSAAGIVGCRINGIPVSVTYATSDANTATLLTAAINAEPRLMNLVRAVNSASGVVTIISLEAGDQMPAVGARGTGVTVGGVTTPKTTITISTGSGTLSAYVNGILVASITATGTDATDAVALAAAINRSFVARRYGVATSSAGVVTFTSSSGISLSAFGTGATASADTLTAAGTYGGIAGNALTLTGAVGVTRSAATLSGGISGLLVTASVPGTMGNAITFAAGGAAAAHLTASSARLVSGAETVETFAFP